MNMKTVIPLVVAIVLAVVAAKLGKDMIAKGKTDTGPGLKMNKIVVAKGDVAPGSVLQETDLTTSNFPSEGAPLGTFLDPKEVVGRVVMTQLVKGQAVLDTLLAQKGASGGASAMVPAGMRAVTLEVNEVSGVAGLLSPGCKVDVVQTIRMKDEDGDNMMAKTIVEDLRVIAVGRRTSTVGPEPEQLARSVTVLATQEQSEIIDLASRMGTPRLVLRNTLDNKKLGGKGVTVASLRGSRSEEGGDAGADVLARIFGNPTTKPSKTKGPITKVDQHTVTVPVSVPAAIPQFREVEIIRAGSSSNVKFPVAPTTPSGPMTGGSDKLESVIPGSR